MSSQSRWLIVTFALVFISLTAGGFWFYRSEEHRQLHNAETILLAIADLKASAIARWRADRLDDAALITEIPPLLAGVSAWLADPNAEATARLRSLLGSIRLHSHSSDVLIVDPQGQVRLSLTGTAGPLHGSTALAFAAAARERHPVLGDLEVDVIDSSPYIDSLIPIFSVDKPLAPAAALILRAQASQELYPIVNAWPVPTATEESALVRRDGDDVLFLNPPRRESGAALTLRWPLSREDLSTVKAVRGQTGVVETTDSRGVRVLSALEAIPDSPWFLVATIDEAEAMAGWQMRSLLILVTVLGLLATAAAVTGAIWTRRTRRHYRALAEAEARSRAVLNAVGATIAVLDHRGMILAVNRSWEMFARKNGDRSGGAATGVGSNYLNVIRSARGESTEGAAAALEGLQAILDGLRGEYLAEYPCHSPDKRRWFLLVATPLEGGGAVVAHVDITDRRQAAEALRESEERFRLAAEVTGFGSYAYDGVSGVAYMSPELKKLYGLRPDDPFPQDKDLVPTAIHPEDRAAYLAAMTASGDPRGNGVLDLDFRIIRTDGAVRWLRVYGVTRFIGEGADRRPYHTVGATTDITERREAQEAIRRSEARYRTLFENMMEGFAFCRLVFDAQGRPVDWVYLSVNKAFEPLTGLKNVIGRRVTEIIPGLRDANPDLFECFGRVASTGRPEKLETYVGPLTAWLHVAVYRPAPGHFVAIFENITERKATEAALAVHARNMEHVSAAAIQLMRPMPGNELFVCAARQLQAVAGRAIVVLNEYLPEAGQVVVRAIAGPEDKLKVLATVLGRDPTGLAFEADAETLRQTVRGVLLNVPGGLHKLTFEQIPPDLCGRVEEQLALGDSYVLPLAFGDEMLGTVVILTDRCEGLRNPEAIEPLVSQASLALKRTRAEEALRESEQRYRRLVEVSPEAIFVNRENKLVLINAAGLRLFGATRPEEMLGKSPYDFTHPDYHKAIHERIRRQLELGEPAPPMEQKIFRLDGTVVSVEVMAAPVMFGGVMAVQAVLRDMTERKRIEERMTRYQQRLRALGAKLVHAEEQERRRIAADLHDSVVQTLALAKLKTQQFRAENPEARSSATLDQIQDIVTQAIMQSRSLVFDLSPPPLYELGLEAAIEWLVEKSQAEPGPRVTFVSDGLPKPLSEDVRVVLYRAVRELLTNVAKHAGARSARITTHLAGHWIEIEVSDDGAGFDVESLQKPKATDSGFGLFYIRERMDTLGGSLSVTSPPGVGTFVTLRAPLEPIRKAD